MLRPGAVLPLCGLLLGGPLLAGCQQLAGLLPTRATADSAAAVAVPPDPVATFAGQATPGQEGSVVLPETGRAARVRLQRAYFAASGRECRDVLVNGSETRLVCRLGQAWVAARPLMLGRGDRSGLRS